MCTTGTTHRIMFTLLLLCNAYIHTGSETVVSSQWNILMEKTISMCINTATSKTKCMQMNQYLSGHLECLFEMWMTCQVPQEKKIPESDMDGKVMNHQPCYKGHFKWRTNIETVYNIEVHKTFQLNLTFTSFNLVKSFSGCVYHHIMVRII